MLAELLAVAAILSALVYVLPGPVQRYAVVNAMRAEECNVPAAEKLYNKMQPGHPVSKFKDFALRWWRRDQRQEGVQNKKQKEWDRKKLDDATAKVLAEEWTQQGVGRGVYHRAYDSMEEVWPGGGKVGDCSLVAAAAADTDPGWARPCLQLAYYFGWCHGLQAMSHHPEIKKLCARNHYTAKYLEKRCKQAVPGWRIGYQPEKKAFTAQQKRERLAFCREMVEQPLEFWQSTVFVDEHTFYRRPYPLKGITIGRRLYKNKDKRLRRYPWSYPKLQFMYGVHWKLGVLGPYWISTCQGWKIRTKFPVGADAHLCFKSALPTQRLVGGCVEDEGGQQVLVLCVQLGCMQCLPPLCSVLMVQPHH